MAYILTAQLMDDSPVQRPMDRYLEYLQKVQPAFPPNAFALATASWYHDFSDHRCPHDAWLEELRVIESGVGDRSEKRSTDIRMRLLGAYHDGHIELVYRDVHSYRCELGPSASEAGRGQRDWRYDEFRLADAGRVIHEIEWWGRHSTGTWLINAADVEFNWSPLPSDT